MNRFNKILVAVSITFALVFSLRVVVIPTPLNPAEQIGLIGLMIDYTMRRSKELD